MFNDEIKKAIGAHGRWKGRLTLAIETGKSEFTPDKVSADRHCDFGQWLYGPTIPGAEKAGEHYKAVQKLHAEFHKIAGDVLSLALAGKKDEARKLMGAKSRYLAVSAALTGAMMKWERAA